jgi:3-dehydroquinate synthetase
MLRDKKVQDGVMNLVLLKNMGEAVLSNDYDSKALDAVLERT